MTGYSNNSILVAPVEDPFVSFTNDYDYDYDIFEKGSLLGDRFDNDSSYADNGHNPLFDHSIDADFNQRYNQSISVDEEDQNKEYQKNGVYSKRQ